MDWAPLWPRCSPLETGLTTLCDPWLAGVPRVELPLRLLRKRPMQILAGLLVVCVKSLCTTMVWLVRRFLRNLA